MCGDAPHCDALPHPAKLYCLLEHILGCLRGETPTAETVEKIAMQLEQNKIDLKTSISGFKTQVDVTVNSFLLEDKTRILATLESAASSAISPKLLRTLIEKTVSANLAGNPRLLKQLVAESARNDHPLNEIRAEIVTALAGTPSESGEAVKNLVGFAIRPGASVGAQKKLLVNLGSEAVRKNRDLLKTARLWQSVFNTGEDVVAGTIGTLIGAATGSGDRDAKTVAASAFSNDPFIAGGVLLSGYVGQGGALRTLVGTTQSDTWIARDIKKSVNGLYGGDLSLQFYGDKPKPSGYTGKLDDLLKNVNNIQEGLSGKVDGARKSFDKSTATGKARNIARTAAQNAKWKASAAAGKAYSGSGNK